MDRDEVAQFYGRVRATTRDIVDPLEQAEWLAQPIPEVSPPRWMLGHVTWLFEQAVLRNHEPNYLSHDLAYSQLLNSYYLVHGEPHPRGQRGLQSRPSIQEVKDYADSVDDRIGTLITEADDPAWQEIAPLLLVGLHHEQQHQELALNETRYILFSQGASRVYHERVPVPDYPLAEPTFLAFDGGTYSVGSSEEGFSFDIEHRRRVLIDWDFQLRNTLVTKGDYLAFMDDGGYEKWEPWLREGFHRAGEKQWTAPRYWRHTDHDGQNSPCMVGNRSIQMNQSPMSVFMRLMHSHDGLAIAYRLQKSGKLHPRGSIPLKGTSSILFAKVHFIRSQHEKEMDFFKCLEMVGNGPLHDLPNILASSHFQENWENITAYG